jgi:hypothetical protein
LISLKNEGYNAEKELRECLEREEENRNYFMEELKKFKNEYNRLKN